LLVANGSVADAGKYIVIWKKDGGTWKLHRDIWTTSPPAKN
jgi:ketosteroid isomerase-like protein